MADYPTYKFVTHFLSPRGEKAIEYQLTTLTEIMSKRKIKQAWGVGEVKLISATPVFSLQLFTVTLDRVPFQYQNGYWDLLFCPTQPIFTNTETALLSR